MKCTVENCTGDYETRLVSQVFVRDGKSIVIENIPALVCDTCGDIILRWQTAERLLRALEREQPTTKYAPVYTFEAVSP